MGISVGAALIIGGVLSAVGTVAQFVSAQKASKKQERLRRESIAAQQRAEAAQKRAADLQAQRRRIQLVREARISRARALQLGENRGLGGGSSAIRGSVASVTTDLASSLSFLDQTKALNDLARVEFGRAREIASRTVKQSGIGSLISTAGGLVLGAAQAGVFGSQPTSVPKTQSFSSPVTGFSASGDIIGL